jgi:hypothetical protein
MSSNSKPSKQIVAMDSVVRTLNTVSTVPKAKNPFVNPAGASKTRPSVQPTPKALK